MLLQNKFTDQFTDSNALKLGCALFALAAGLALLPASAQAQQVQPGTSAQCPITMIDGELVAVCEGDLADGVAAFPGSPNFDRIEIRNPDAPIAPNGITAINLVKNNGDLEILIEDGVIINVFDDLANPLITQGVLAIAQNDFDVLLTSGADITADGNGSFGIGIDAVAQDGGGVTLTNTGNVSAFTTGEGARAISAFVESSAGDVITVTNSGALSAASGGTGERDFATSGILAISQAQSSEINIDNTGDITVTSADGRFDTDFNGIAAGIVSNSFGSGTFTTINNSGSITATGPQVDGIVGFARVESPTEGSLVRIVNDGTITATGTANRGIFAQTQGQLAEVGVINNAAINITGDNSFGIFALHNDIFAPDINTSEAMLSVRNEGVITVDGNNANGVFIQNNARSGTIILSNTADINGSGPLTRGLGISSFFGVPDGDYEYLFENSGDITLDSEAARGITVFSSFDDAVDLTFVNEGNLDLSATTNALSSGIEINLNDSEFDTRGTGTESTSLANVTNTGDITMGAGQAVIISADQITFENTGNLSTAADTSDVVVVEADVLNVILTDASLSSTGANSGAIVQEHDASSGGSTSTYVLTQSAISTEGESSRGLSIDRVAQGSNTLNVLIDETDFTTLGVNSDAFHLGSIKFDSVLSVTVTRSDFETEGDGSHAFYSESLGNNSATTIALQESTFSTLGNASSAIVVGDVPDDLNLVSRDGSIFALAALQTIVSTAGDESHGLVITPAGGPDSESVIEVSESNFSTLGSGSDAIRLTLPGSTVFQAPSGDLGGFQVRDTTLSTQGDDSALVRVDSLDGSDVINVIVTNSTLSSTGDNSVAIVQQYGANAGGASTTYQILDSTIDTQGVNAYGLTLQALDGDANATNITIQRSQISTAGNQADGIFSGTLGDGSVRSVNLEGIEITTLGDGARGLVTDALNNGSVDSVFLSGVITTEGDNGTGVLVGDLSSGAGQSGADGSTFALDFDGEIATAGDDSRGVDVASLAGDSSTTVVTISESAIATGGANSNAISVGSQRAVGQLSSHSVAIEDAAIDTSGDDSLGIWIGSITDGLLTTDQGNGDATFGISGNTITTQGSRAHGIEFAEVTGDVTGGLLDIATTNNTITTTGEGAVAIKLGDFSGGLSGSDNFATDISVSLAPTLITTQGDGAHGIELGDLTYTDPDPSTSILDDDGVSSELTIDAAEIRTAGDGAHGVVLGEGWSAPDFSFDRTNEGDARIATLSGDISTSGDGSVGVLTQSGLVIENTTIGTTGAGGEALLASDYTAAEFTLAGSTLTTAGTQSDVFRMVAQGPGTRISNTLSDVNLSSSGEDSALLRITGLEQGDVVDVLITNGTLSSMGDRSSAIVQDNSQSAGGSNSAYFFEDTTITTSGDSSAGFDFGRETDLGGGSIASFTVNQSTIATVGNGSDAFFTGSLREGSISSTTITNSQFSTEGNDSRAYVNEAIDGASAYSVTLNGNTFSTLGQNSTAVLIADQTDLDLRSNGDGSIFNVSFEGSISTEGDNSRGIDVASLLGDQSTVVLSIESSTISTNGTNSDAISIGTQGGVGARQSQLSSSFDFLTVATSGDDSRGLFFDGLQNGLTIDETAMSGAIDSDAVVFLGNSSFSTQGARSHGIEFGDLPDFAGADEAPIGLAIVSVDVSTSGEEAHGIVIGEGWGVAGATAEDINNLVGTRFAQITVDGTIEVSGLGSHGVVSNSLINDFQITDTGRITSAQGFAIKLDGSDEDFTILNAGTVDGDVIFGDGDDTFDTSGVFTGNIDLAGGANAIFVRSGGVFNSLDNVLLGAGNAITLEGDLAPGGVLGSDGGGPFQTTMIGSDLLFQDGSRLLVDVDGMNMDDSFFVSDRILVDGDIAIGDSTLVVSSLTTQGDFDQSAQFLILNAAGTLTGEFTSIEADLPFLDLSLTYEANQAILNAGRQTIVDPVDPPAPVVAFASVAQTPNQFAVASSFDALEADASGDLDDVIEQLIFANTAQALTAFDSASGEIYAALLTQGGQDGLRRSREALARSRSALAEGWGIWGGAAFSDASIDSDGNAARVSQDDLGFDIGIDYAGKDNSWAVGIVTGWRDGDLDVRERQSTADYNSWHLGGFSRTGNGGAGLTLSLTANYSQSDANVLRTLDINAISRTAMGEVDIDTFSLGVEARYGFASGDGWALGPVVSLLHANSDLSLDTETGAGSVALTSADASHDVSRLGGGLFVNWRSDASAFDLSAQYVEGESDAVGARLAFADGASAPFTVLAPTVDGSGVLAAASARLSLGNGWSLGAQVDALIASEAEDVSASAVIGWRF